MDPPPDNTKQPAKSDEKAPQCDEEMSLGYRCCLRLGHAGLHHWKGPDGREFSWG